MKTIAILCGRYLPGYKDGGPVRTIINLVDSLGEKYHFVIITSDRDHGDKYPYKGIIYNQANRVGNAEVFYLKEGKFKFSNIRKLTDKADLIYVCGPYNAYAYKTLILKRIGLLKQQVVVASMGSFSKGAFKIKSCKKKIFVDLCKKTGLYQKILWSVTSELEKKDVEDIVGKEANCCIAEDLPRKVSEISITRKGMILKVIFISRISKKKNLLYAMDILNNIKSSIIFDIYGPLEDKEYWGKCQKKLNELPANIQWTYKGMADSEQVINIFSDYDVFLFPTQGENYGHVIFESLAGGCIPVISDQTSWGEIETEKCGRVISLSNFNEFVSEIQKLAEMDRDKLIKTREKANRYAVIKYEESVKDTGYMKIFGLDE